MECNQLGQIRFTCNASAMNVVDMLTKALFKTVLEQHQAALGLLITWFFVAWDRTKQSSGSENRSPYTRYFRVAKFNQPIKQQVTQSNNDQCHIIRNQCMSEGSSMCDNSTRHGELLTNGRINALKTIAIACRIISPCWPLCIMQFVKMSENKSWSNTLYCCRLSKWFTGGLPMRFHTTINLLKKCKVSNLTRTSAVALLKEGKSDGVTFDDSAPTPFTEYGCCAKSNWASYPSVRVR